MNKVQTLYELQKVDLEIEARDKELTQVLEQLGDDAVLREQRAVAEEIRGRVEALEKRRQSLDWETNDLQARIVPLDKKLYSGQVKVPKELVSLQQEVEMLKAQRRQLEDSELAIMLELDDTNRQLQEATQEMGTLESQWNEDQQRLAGARDTLSKELEVLRGQREGIADHVDAATLGKYQRIRDGRQGIAVVSVERGTCTGCRITIPAIEIQRARAGRDLVFCQSCGRILSVG